MNRVEAYVKFKNRIVRKTCQKHWLEYIGSAGKGPIQWIKLSAFSTTGARSLENSSKFARYFCRSAPLPTNHNNLEWILSSLIKIIEISPDARFSRAGFDFFGNFRQLLFLISDWLQFLIHIHNALVRNS